MASVQDQVTWRCLFHDWLCVQRRRQVKGGCPAFNLLRQNVCKCLTEARTVFVTADFFICIVRSTALHQVVV